MKKRLQIFIAVLVLGATLAGCVKDESPGKNYFRIGSTEYDLSGGTILFQEETHIKGLYYIDLALYSKGLDMTDLLNPTGKGNMLYFQILSSSLTDLPAGTYFCEGKSAYKVNTFEADVLFNYVAQTNNSDSTIGISAGSIIFKKNGSEYEITILCTGENGKGITGFYKGRLSNY